jgi:phosphatidate cytidylyltransferase
MLKQRIITAIVLVFISLSALFGANELGWQLAIIGLSMLAAWEWCQFARIEQVGLKLIYAGLSAISIGLAVYIDYAPLIIYLVIVQLIVVMVAVSRYQMTAGAAVLQNRLLNAAIGLVFILSFALAMIALREAPFSAWILLFSMLMIWVMDSGAYFAGRRFGQRKLALHVSPGKTWEGVFGGIILAVLVSAALWWLWAAQLEQQPGLVVFVLFSSLIAALSVYGDLFESLLKRQVGIKDSGKILPGHGGVLDRIDSLLLAIPMFWVFWTLI